MAKTQKRRSPVAVAILLFLVSLVALAAAVYVYDGVGLVTGLVAGLLEGRGSVETTGTGSAEATGLVLPQGVTEEFALRMWREQVDSQRNIRHLVDGELKELRIADPAASGYDGRLPVEARFKDGSRAKGHLFMSQQGANWYVDHITGLRSPETTGSAADTSEPHTFPDTPLPKLADVDVGVLNTIFAEQDKSQEVFLDYLDGNVDRVVITGVKRGPGTATILATMHEETHTVEAQIVAITTDYRGKELWFLTRFSKLKTVPKS